MNNNSDTRKALEEIDHKIDTLTANPSRSDTENAELHELTTGRNAIKALIESLISTSADAMPESNAPQTPESGVDTIEAEFKSSLQTELKKSPGASEDKENEAKLLTQASVLCERYPALQKIRDVLASAAGIGGGVGVSAGALKAWSESIIYSGGLNVANLAFGSLPPLISCLSPWFRKKYLTEVKAVDKVKRATEIKQECDIAKQVYEITVERCKKILEVVRQPDQEGASEDHKKKATKWRSEQVAKVTSQLLALKSHWSITEKKKLEEEALKISDSSKVPDDNFESIWKKLTASDEKEFSVDELEKYAKTIESKSDVDLIDTVEEVEVIKSLNLIEGLRPAHIPDFGNLDQYTHYCFTRISALLRTIQADPRSSLCRGIPEDRLAPLLSFGINSGAKLCSLYDISRSYAMWVSAHHEKHRDAKINSVAAGVAAAGALTGIGGALPAFGFGIGWGIRKFLRSYKAPKYMEFDDSGVLQGKEGVEIVSPEVARKGGALFSVDFMNNPKKEEELTEAEKHWKSKMDHVPRRIVDLCKRGKIKSIQEFAAEFDLSVTNSLVGKPNDFNTGIDPRKKAAGELAVKNAEDDLKDVNKTLDELKAEKILLQQQISSLKKDANRYPKDKDDIMIEIDQKNKRLNHIAGDDVSGSNGLILQVQEKVMEAKAKFKTAQEALLDINHPKPKKPEEMTPDELAEYNKKLLTWDAVHANNAMKQAFAVMCNKHWDRYKDAKQGTAKRIWGSVREGVLEKVKSIGSSGSQETGKIAANIAKGSAMFGIGSLMANGVFGATLLNPVSWATIGVGYGLISYFRSKAANVGQNIAGKVVDAVAAKATGAKTGS